MTKTKTLVGYLAKIDNRDGEPKGNMETMVEKKEAW